MRNLIFILITIFFLLKQNNRIIQITIILPAPLISYYEWLNDFPRPQDEPEDSPENWAEHHLEINHPHFKYKEYKNE